MQKRKNISQMTLSNAKSWTSLQTKHHQSNEIKLLQTKGPATRWINNYQPEIITFVFISSAYPGVSVSGGNARHTFMLYGVT